MQYFIFKKNLKVMMFIFLNGLILNQAYAQASQNSGPPPSPVKVEKARMLEELPTATMMGTIYSQNQVQLTAGVNGRLDWVVEPGSYLRQGDKIAQVELLPLQLRQAERKTQFERAKINFAYLKNELKRQNKLRAKNSISQLQLDQTQSQVDIAKADLNIAELQLKQINQELERATIVSPFEGVITQRHRRAGFDVNRSDILVDILDIKNLEVRVFIPVKYLAHIRADTAVKLSSKNSQAVTDAFVSTIIPAADPLSQTFEMRIKIPKKNTDVWSIGQLLDVQFPIASHAMSLAVHRDALLLRSDGTYIIKIDENNIAHRLKVEVGKGYNDWVTVDGEINEGDQIAVRGAERLIEGQTVVIQKAI